MQRSAMSQDAQHFLSNLKLLFGYAIMKCEHQHDFVERARGEWKPSTARRLNNREVWNIASNDTPKSGFDRFGIWIRANNIGLW